MVASRLPRMGQTVGCGSRLGHVMAQVYQETKGNGKKYLDPAMVWTVEDADKL